MSPGPMTSFGPVVFMEAADDIDKEDDEELLRRKVNRCDFLSYRQNHYSPRTINRSLVKIRSCHIIIINEHASDTGNGSYGLRLTV